MEEKFIDEIEKLEKKLGRKICGYPTTKGLPCKNQPEDNEEYCILHNNIKNKREVIKRIEESVEKKDDNELKKILREVNENKGNFTFNLDEIVEEELTIENILKSIDIDKLLVEEEEEDELTEDEEREFVKQINIDIDKDLKFIEDLIMKQKENSKIEFENSKEPNQTEDEIDFEKGNMDIEPDEIVESISALDEDMSVENNLFTGEEPNQTEDEIDFENGNIDIEPDEIVESISALDEDMSVDNSLFTGEEPNQTEAILLNEEELLNEIELPEEIPQEETELSEDIGNELNELLNEYEEPLQEEEPNQTEDILLNEEELFNEIELPEEIPQEETELSEDIGNELNELLNEYEEPLQEENDNLSESEMNMLLNNDSFSETEDEDADLESLLNDYNEEEKLTGLNEEIPIILEEMESDEILKDTKEESLLNNIFDDSEDDFTMEPIEPEKEKLEELNLDEMLKKASKKSDKRKDEPNKTKYFIIKHKYKLILVLIAFLIISITGIVKIVGNLKNNKPTTVIFNNMKKNEEIDRMRKAKGEKVEDIIQKQVDEKIKNVSKNTNFIGDIGKKEMLIQELNELIVKRGLEKDQDELNKIDDKIIDTHNKIENIDFEDNEITRDELKKNLNPKLTITKIDIIKPVGSNLTINLVSSKNLDKEPEKMSLYKDLNSSLKHIFEEYNNINVVSITVLKKDKKILKVAELTAKRSEYEKAIRVKSNTPRQELSNYKFVELE